MGESVWTSPACMRASLVTVCLLLSRAASQPSLALSQYFAQDGLVGHVPSHGCGPNPLVLLLSEMPVWLQRTLALTTNGDMMRTIRSDENIRREFLEFKKIVRRFKDCIKTGDGIRAKKSRIPPELPYFENVF